MTPEQASRLAYGAPVEVNVALGERRGHVTAVRPDGRLAVSMQDGGYWPAIDPRHVEMIEEPKHVRR